MPANHGLEELLAYRSDHPVLSVYLDLPPSAGMDGQRLALRELTRRFEDEAPDDVEAIRRFLDHEHGGSGRALVLFSNQQDGLFRSISLAVPLRSRARRLDRPYLKPLVDLLDSYGHLGVAIVDRQTARFYHLDLGEVVAEDGFEGEPVRRVKSGGGSQDPSRRGGAAGQTRSAEELAERNLRQAATEASKFFKAQGVRRIVVAGTDENQAYFHDALPKAWRSLIIGGFPADMSAGTTEIAARAMQVASQVDEQHEQKLVERMVTAAAKRQDGVLGLDQTLEAVHAGKVLSLVVGEGYRAAGLRCGSCGYLTTQPLESCPFCGGEMAKITDAVEDAIQAVLDKGGKVEVVHDNVQLEQAGRIGALLRY